MLYLSYCPFLVIELFYSFQFFFLLANKKNGSVQDHRVDDSAHASWNLQLKRGLNDRDMEAMTALF